MIPFNMPPYIGVEQNYIAEALIKRKFSGDGNYTKLASQCIEDITKSLKILLTTSCTHALEMSAFLCDIKAGDEVIMPSYTFCSTADAFVLRGAKIKFVDIRKDTMNIDENLIENAINEHTRAIVSVHYAGVSCEMNKIMQLANKYNIKVVEDAAQGFDSYYEDKALGSIGDFGCFSFHETKNLSMGEGGALLIKSKNDIERAEILREKGTNRSKFFRGEIDKYTWVEAGSSYLPSEILVSFLYAQLLNKDEIKNNRMTAWNYYFELLSDLKNKGKIELPTVPSNCKHNAHMFYIKCEDIEERTKLIDACKKNDIYPVFHYIPLHSAPAGKKYGEFVGEDKNTTKESERLLRLPMYYGLKKEDIEKIVKVINDFYR